MVFVPTKENVSDNSDWIACGTFAKNRKATIDPLTGANLGQAATLPSANIKNGGSKNLTFKITGVSNVLIILASTSSSESRYAVAKVSEEGSENSETYISKSTTATQSVILSLVLDETKKYTINLFGQKAEGTYADVAVFGITFVKSETLKTANSTFATYCAPYPVDYADNGLAAYSISLDEAHGKVSYTKINGPVPANTSVLVKGGCENDYILIPAEIGADKVITDLTASDGTIEGDGSTIYAFGTKNGVSGFKIVKAGVKIPAKKGYLKLSSSAGAKDFYAFGDETTGINNISANGIDEEETPLFNLAGQRVNKSYKGVVVKNGKKFVNK